MPRKRLLLVILKFIQLNIKLLLALLLFLAAVCNNFSRFKVCTAAFCRHHASCSVYSTKYFNEACNTFSFHHKRYKGSNISLSWWQDLHFQVIKKLLHAIQIFHRKCLITTPGNCDQALNHM